MENKEIRWLQRFSNYNKALLKMNDIVSHVTKEKVEEGSIISNIYQQAIIQSFEYTYELAWKVMKDYAKYQGNNQIGGARDAIREALQLDLIEDGDTWMEMITSSNKTSHTYDESSINEIFEKIMNKYSPAFNAFQINIEKKEQEHN